VGESDAMRVGISVDVNGTLQHRSVEPRQLLVEFLRVECGFTGTHVGCDTSYCGACTVLLDDRPVKSCTLLAVQADGCRVQTVEGLERADGLHPLQAAFTSEHGLQCGYCTPGMLMAAARLLAEHPDPTDEQIRHGLAGNVCRCTGYDGIIAAVRAAARAMRGGATS
jgi:aerobic carbon-monoxide dehydrogenase small subunit